MSIETEIDVCITKCGKGYREWYVGVAANPDERLFQGHNVSQDGGAWIYRDAGSVSGAKIIEAIFHKKGCKGAAGNTDRSHFVYAYRMTRTTRGV